MVEDLIADHTSHLEALLAGNRVHDEVPMDPDKVLRVKDAVLVLAGSVDDLGREILVLIPDDFAEGILDGWIVALHEVTVDELDSQTRFA